MKRSAARKTFYLASATFTLMLLGCSAADVSHEATAQAGKSSTGGNRGLLGGLAGATNAASAGAGGTGPSSVVPAGGTAAVGTGGATMASGGAATGGTTAANPVPGVAGFSFGGADSFSLGFAGFGGGDEEYWRKQIEAAFAGAKGIPSGSGGAVGSDQFGIGGTRIWFSN